MRTLALDAQMPYVALCVDSNMSPDISPAALGRMATIMENCGAAMVYSDYRTIAHDAVTDTLCTEYLEGSVRDDFSFGPLVMVNQEMFRQAVEEMEREYEYAAWYDVRLRLYRKGAIVHIPEMLYTATPLEHPDKGGERQLDYVNPRNRKVQIEMEQAFTSHLKAIGAYLAPQFDTPDFGDGFPVEATIVIPVKNRVNTIADAVFSALDQQAPFDYNVIVVDNHSDDGTTEVLRRLSEGEPRLLHLIPDSHTLGIGGCWNLALSHAKCGRFAVQLDSDDLYSSSDTLARIVETFHSMRCAMVVGSYSLTDFALNPIPPGTIDHREWTDGNGRNNALRINGLGAPRAFATAIARSMPMPDVSYGEDYAMGLRMSRNYRIGRIYEVLYLCRRWEGNSDAALSMEKANRYNFYKDCLRTWEIEARRKLNATTP